jgi:heterodisulfide reductase subunit C
MLEKKLDFARLKKCNDCGACYDVCPSSLHIKDYDPRVVIKDILAGKSDKWISSDMIWQCLECHHCVEICFQSYGFEDAMTAMRLLATLRGVHPPQIRRGWDMFVKTGKLGEPNMQVRKRLGLPEPAVSGKEEFVKLFEAYSKAVKAQEAKA